MNIFRSYSGCERFLLPLIVATALCSSNGTLAASTQPATDEIPPKTKTDSDSAFKRMTPDELKQMRMLLSQGGPRNPEHRVTREARMAHEKAKYHNPKGGAFQLCEEWNSGSPSENLVWVEGADKLLHLLGRNSTTGMEGADRLFPVLNDRNLYNMFLAPGQPDLERTDVKIAMYIESMSSFKAQSMDFEVDMYLALSWVDKRLKHNCTHAILVTSKRLLELIWHPDLYFVNSKFGYLQEVTTPNMMLLVYPDGMIFQSIRVDVTLACMMELHGFPMDTQRCQIKIQSYAYVEEVLNLLWHVDPEAEYPLSTNPIIRLNDMVIVDRQWKTCGYPYKLFRGYGTWSCLEASIVMRRLILFHIIQTYIPTAMLVVISWLSFYLDARASPARIGLTITTLLTLTTMSNGARQDLPQVSYVKALDIWLAFCTVFVFSVLLEYTLVSFFITRKTTSCHHLQLARRMKSAMTNMVSQPELIALANVGKAYRKVSTQPHAVQFDTVEHTVDPRIQEKVDPGDEKFFRDFLKISRLQQRKSTRESERQTGVVGRGVRRSSTEFDIGSSNEDIRTALLVNQNTVLNASNTTPTTSNGGPGATVYRQNDSSASNLLTVNDPRTQRLNAEEAMMIDAKKSSTGGLFSVASEQRKRHLSPCLNDNVVQSSPVNRASRRGRSCSPSTEEVLRKPCALCAQNWERIGKRIDKVSRVAFPLLFTFFTMVYWAYYVCSQCRLPDWMPAICGDCYELPVNHVRIPQGYKVPVNQSFPANIKI